MYLPRRQKVKCLFLLTNKNLSLLMDEKIYKQAAKYIADAQAVVITAGAGMGADSGLPTFRGTEGFWRAYPYAKKLGVSFEQLANPQWFKSDPSLAWAFYGHRLNLYRKTRPHKGYELLLKWSKDKPFSYFVFTSNVDGQFQKANFSDQQIVEIHGSIHYLQCTVPCGDDIWEAANVEVKVDLEKFRAVGELPRCPYCGAIARPNILMFGDWTWIPWRTEEQEARFNAWLDKLWKYKARVVIIEIGAGTAVPTVRLTSENLAMKFNAPLIRINPDEPQIPRGINGLSIAQGALAALSKIDSFISG